MIDDVFTGNGAGHVPGTEGYTEAADVLIPQYESMSFEQCHEPELHLLPTLACRVLDVGAGSGRDAAWFADRGHSVLAVEPTAAFRTAAMVLHPSRSIEWLDDSLPELAMVLSRNQLFEVILLSAVWMHLDASDRRAAMLTLASLLSRDGTLLISLRHGPVPLGRCMFDVSGEETITIAGQYGLRPVLNVRCDSIQASNRAIGVTWTRLAFRKFPRKLRM